MVEYTMVTMVEHITVTMLDQDLDQLMVYLMVDQDQVQPYAVNYGRSRPGPAYGVSYGRSRPGPAYAVTYSVNYGRVYYGSYNRAKTWTSLYS